MQGADKGSDARPDGRGLRVGLVQARFNEGLTGRMAAACRAELEACGVAAADITHVTVPGALEVPLALAAMAAANTGAKAAGSGPRFHALVALGCVIRGETYHFELVANESGAGVTRVGLDHRIPIANAILTVENEAQAEARADEKSRDAARVAVEMARLLETLS